MKLPTEAGLIGTLASLLKRILIDGNPSLNRNDEVLGAKRIGNGFSTLRIRILNIGTRRFRHSAYSTRNGNFPPLCSDNGTFA